MRSQAGCAATAFCSAGRSRHRLLRPRPFRRSAGLVTSTGAAVGCARRHDAGSAPVAGGRGVHLRRACAAGRRWANWPMELSFNAGLCGTAPAGGESSGAGWRRTRTGFDRVAHQFLHRHLLVEMRLTNWNSRRSPAAGAPGTAQQVLVRTHRRVRGRARPRRSRGITSAYRSSPMPCSFWNSALMCFPSPSRRRWRNAG